MEPHRGWTITSSSWNCVQKRWLDREQELITVIQEVTNLTEEKKEAGYRSQIWSILRALQKINKTRRHKGEAVMSAPPFFHSAGRGYLKFWKEDGGHTVVVWGKFIRIRARTLVEKDGQVEGLDGLVQVEEERRRAKPV